MKSQSEIRLDCLKQAQDLLSGQYEAAEKVAADTFFDMLDKGLKTSKDKADFMPKFPSIEDVIKEANKFYGFVSTR